MKIITLLGLVAIFSANCSQSTEPEKTAPGFKRVSISAAERFSGNTAAIPGWDAFHRSFFRAPIDSLLPHSSAKSLALIDFKEARVIVVNNYEYFRQKATASQADFMCQMFQGQADAFYGKDLQDWNTFSAAMSRFPFYEAVYSGTLEKNGDHIEGDILVKPGSNIASICFINSQNRIFWISAGNYIYLSEILSSLAPGDTTQFTDGWETDSSTGKIWDDVPFTAHERLPEPPTYPHPYFSDLGWISKPQADTMCTFYRYQP